MHGERGNGMQKGKRCKCVCNTKLVVGVGGLGTYI